MIKVLIIEDELELLDNLARYLTSFEAEFAVLTAPSGEEGLAQLAADPDINLLLTDVRLPGIDGIEVVRKTVEQWPEVRIIVMTAFGSSELRQTAETEGALRFIEKPVDLDELPSVLREVYESRHRRSRAVGGLDILDVAQFVAMAKETKVIRFQNDRGQGTLVFENGTLVHCTAGRLKGADALFDMTLWGEGSFFELFDVETRRYRKNVNQSTAELLEQAVRFSREVADDDPFDTGPPPEQPAGVEPVLGADQQLPAAAATAAKASAPAQPDPASTTRSEQRPATADRADKGAASTRGAAAKGPATKGPAAQQQAAPSPATNTTTTTTTKEDQSMAIKDQLAELQDVEGFQGAAVFTAQGEMLEGIAKAKVDIKSIGMYANNALLNAQKATEQMGVGRGNMMQIRAPQAVVLMRCLNEATDFAATKTGKAHFHTVVVMDPEGNTGMASMILEKVVGKVSEELR